LEFGCLLEARASPFCLFLLLRDVGGILGASCALVVVLILKGALI